MCVWMSSLMLWPMWKLCISRAVFIWWKILLKSHTAPSTSPGRGRQVITCDVTTSLHLIQLIHWGYWHNRHQARSAGMDCSQTGISLHSSTLKWADLRSLGMSEGYLQNTTMSLKRFHDAETYFALSRLQLIPSKCETLIQWCVNVGPASSTLGLH